MEVHTKPEVENGEELLEQIEEYRSFLYKKFNQELNRYRHNKRLYDKQYDRVYEKYAKLRHKLDDWETMLHRLSWK